MQPKNSTYSDRQAASVAAKKALLEKFKPKPMVQAETLIDHEAERRARAEAARLEAAAAAEQARLDAELSVDAQKRAERKARKKEVKEAAKAKKEERSAAKPVGPRGEPRAVDPFEEHRRYIESLERGRERRRA
jgi:Family of unknown function (DUF6481)